MSLTNIPDNILSGRLMLRTDLTEFNEATLAKDLSRVLKSHAYNRERIRFLQEYLKGYHPAIWAREKTTRTDVDNKVTVNYAYAFTRDIVGYFLGKPIQYTHRKGKYRKQMENFNAALHAENKALVDYQIAQDCSVCGIGYRGSFTESSPRNGTALKLLRLDPLDTFVVYPSDPTKPPAYAVTSYETTADGITSSPTSTRKRVYTVYTPRRMYVFEDDMTPMADPHSGGEPKLVSSKEIYFGGNLPITEYQNNVWRLGDWEVGIAMMDALDAVASDGVNDIQQAVNSVLVALGADLTDEVFEKLSTHGFLSVSNIPAGVRPEIKFISEAMNAEVGVAMRDYLESTLRVIVGVPDRKSRPGGGGDTGDAVFLRDGWQDIDLVAASKEPYFIQSEREALATILYILDTKGEASNLIPSDIEIHFNRNKTANLQSKSQVFQTLRAAGLAPEDALDIADLTNNVHDVIMRMKAFEAENAEKRMNQPDVSNGGSNPDGGDAASTGDDTITE